MSHNDADNAIGGMERLAAENIRLTRERDEARLEAVSWRGRVEKAESQLRIRDQYEAETLGTAAGVRLKLEIEVAQLRGEVERWHAACKVLASRVHIWRGDTEKDTQGVDFTPGYHTAHSALAAMRRGDLDALEAALGLTKEKP